MGYLRDISCFLHIIFITPEIITGFIMCLICVQIMEDKLTAREARQNLGELHVALTKEHILEVLKLIWQKEDEDWDLGSD